MMGFRTRVHQESYCGMLKSKRHQGRLWYHFMNKLSSTGAWVCECHAHHRNRRVGPRRHGRMPNACNNDM